MKISQALIKIDQFLDYIPLASTINNFTDIFTKVVLKCLPSSVSNNNKYCAHIKNKSVLDCVMLTIPVIGNLYVFVFKKEDYTNKLTKTEIELFEQTKKIRLENELQLKNINTFMEIVNANPKLKEIIEKEMEDKKHTLLPPPPKKDHGVMKSPIVQEWHDQCEQKLQIEFKLARIKDALENLPNSTQALGECIKSLFPKRDEENLTPSEIDLSEKTKKND